MSAGAAAATAPAGLEPPKVGAGVRVRDKNKARPGGRVGVDRLQG